ncbi:MAG: AbrB family transcriptional regulator [Proteobacteria bacterium]|nr:AbrB family transcriptional regulator [Pseudomonadota bacterium]
MTVLERPSSQIRAALTDLRRNGWRLALTLLLGGLGAAGAVQISAPLPWILGPLITTLILSVAGAPMWIPYWLRVPGYAVLGALFGASVSFDAFHDLGIWTISMSGMALYVAITIPLGTIYLQKICGYDHITAFFSAAPGGLLPMSAMGGSLGGDERIIALVQSARLVVTVLLIPISFRLFAGYEPQGGKVTGLSLYTPEMGDWIMLLTAIILGTVVGKLIRLPSHTFLGPFVAVLIVNLTTDFNPNPPDAVAGAAQILIGCGIGAGFAKIKARTVANILGHGASVGIGMIVLAMLFAVLLTRLSPFEFPALALAFAPGGMAEMTLVGFALGLDVAFVIGHQLGRFLLIMAYAPFAFARWSNARKAD